MPRLLLAIPLALAMMVATVAWAADDNADTPKAAATRTKLTSTKVDEVEWKDSLLRDVLDELFKEKGGGIGVRTDRTSVVLNTKITYKAKDKSIDEILNDLCDKYEMGWYITQTGTYNGSVWLEKSKARGYEPGKEPSKTAVKPEPKKEEPKKEEPKTEPKPEPKPEPKEPTDEEAERLEKTANNALKFARDLVSDGKVAAAKDYLKTLIRKYPKTKAAETAKELLKKLDE